jgi:hypothetical protein
MSIKLVRVLKKKVQREGVFRELSGEQETVDVVEVITVLAKTVAEMTFGADAALRQQILEHLMREISQYEAEFANAPSRDMRH